MFDFVVNKSVTHNESSALIAELELRYNISFPDILKEYYIRHDGEMIEYCNINTKNDPEIVSKIVSLCNKEFESIKEECIVDGFIPDSMYPLASNRGGDYYFWDSEFGAVYLFYGDDIDSPVKKSNSVKDFFEMLDKSVKH